MSDYAVMNRNRAIPIGLYNQDSPVPLFFIRPFPGESSKACALQCAEAFRNNEELFYVADEKSENIIPWCCVRNQCTLTISSDAMSQQGEIMLIVTRFSCECYLYGSRSPGCISRANLIDKRINYMFDY